MDLKRRSPHSEDSVAPVLLPLLMAATLAVVGAVVLIGQTDSDWADVGAIALLLGTLGIVLGSLLRRLRDE
jgi:predicted ATP-grasp superfamily ATP-dependent carboligase